MKPRIKKLISGRYWCEVDFSHPVQVKGDSENYEWAKYTAIGVGDTAEESYLAWEKNIEEILDEIERQRYD